MLFASSWNIDFTEKVTRPSMLLPNSHNQIRTNAYPIFTFHVCVFRDLSTDNLKFLSSEQALADLAAFIQAKNVEYKFDSNIKWIAFGGSYPGSLAAWFREKYPNLVYGSVSTSGPLLAKADFYGNYSHFD